MAMRRFFFVSVLLLFTAHDFFLSQNAGAEWKFGDRDFCQVCYLSLNTSRYSADPFANFDHQRCRRSQKLALSQKGGEAPLGLEKAAIISERAVLSDTNGSNAPGFEYPPSLYYDLSAVRGRRRQR